MIITWISWGVIFFIFISWGFLGNEMIQKIFRYRITDFFSIIMVGVVLVTCYVEVTSLFINIGAKAFLISFIVCICSFIFFFKSNYLGIIRPIIMKYRCMNSTAKIMVAAVILCVVYFGAFAAEKVPANWDTQNYHAQTIRWLEEYGAVKGLGNLHTRFAYNSSFLCLQALFSFSWIYDRSMHSLNGFFWVFYLTYAFISWRWEQPKEIKLSNIFRFVFLICLFNYSYIADIASPNTDFLPMCITGFIFIKWSELNERGKKGYIEYGLLCLLAIFSISVKLTEMPLILFIIKPLYKMVKSLDYKILLKFSLCSVLVVIPFIIRNILISGYLIYPFPAIDIISCDWKIPKATAESDANAIKLFARGWVEGPLCKWFPQWLINAGTYYGYLNAVDYLVSFIMLGVILYRFLRKIESVYDNMIFAIAPVGYLYLLNQALSVRFGYIWMLLIPSIFVFFILKNTKVLINLELFTIFIIVGVSYNYTKMMFEIGNAGKYVVISLQPNDYRANDGYFEMNGINFYFNSYAGTEYGLNNYKGFPGTEAGEILEKIEMRGDTLKDGFKVRKEFESIPYDFKGRLR